MTSLKWTRGSVEFGQLVDQKVKFDQKSTVIIFSQTYNFEYMYGLSCDLYTEMNIWLNGMTFEWK